MSLEMKTESKKRENSRRRQEEGGMKHHAGTDWLKAAGRRENSRENGIVRDEGDSFKVEQEIRGGRNEEHEEKARRSEG